MATVNKYQLLTDNQLVLPNKCFGCGKMHGNFIDTGNSIDFYGAVYWCTTCFTEQANGLGYQSPEQVSKLEKTIQYLDQENIRLNSECEALNNAVASFDRVQYSGLRSFDVTHLSLNEGEQGTSDEVVGDESASIESESGSDEQDNVGGSSDVHDIEDILNDI